MLITTTIGAKFDAVCSYCGDRFSGIPKRMADHIVECKSGKIPSEIRRYFKNYAKNKKDEEDSTPTPFEEVRKSSLTLDKKTLKKEQQSSLKFQHRLFQLQIKV